MSVKVIHNERLSLYIQKHGIVPKDIKPNRYKKGVVVWEFEETPLLCQILDEYFNAEEPKCQQGKQNRRK